MNDTINDKSDEIPEVSEQANPFWQGEASNRAGELEAETIAYQAPTDWAHRQAIMLLGGCLLVAAMIWLFGLRQKPKEPTEQEKAAEVQIDTALAKLVSMKAQQKVTQLFKDTQGMVQTFYQYPAKQQVMAEELQKNPFLRNADADADDSGDREHLRKKLTEQLDNLRLQSILFNAKGSRCLVEGALYEEGEVIDDAFMIKKIEKDHVVLIASDLEFIFQM